jgi:hypothetical protein
MEQPVDERVVTRLGHGSVTVELDRTLISPISGEEVQALPVPYRWLRDMITGTKGIVGEMGEDMLSIRIGKLALSYGEAGIEAL